MKRFFQWLIESIGLLGWAMICALHAFLWAITEQEDELIFTRGE